MKQLLFTAALALAAGTAHAADSVREPPVDSWSWTGAYVGVNAGGGFGTFKHPVAGLGFDETAGGFLGGIQAGYNWQSGRAVYGVEADLQGSAVQGSYTQFNLANTKVDWFGTLRARIGYTPVDRILVYGTGGLAYGNVKASFDNGIVTSSKTRSGWTIGAGAEYAIDAGWTFKTEYLYTDFGRSTVIPGYGNDVAFHAVRVGLNYMFYASDVVRREAMPAGPSFDWAGGYVGVNAGGGFGTFKHPVVGGNGISFDVTAGGFLGGVQAGYNWQSGQAVYGLEADFQGSATKGAFSISSVPDPYIDTKVGWFGTLRARAGYAPVDRIMIYGTAGLAYGNVETAFGYGAYRSSRTKAGWTIGAGAEYALDANWTFKSEYLYTDFGKSTVSPDISLRNDVAFHLVRAGLNYKF